MLLAGFVISISSPEAVDVDCCRAALAWQPNWGDMAWHRQKFSSVFSLHAGGPLEPRLPPGKTGCRGIWYWWVRSRRHPRIWSRNAPGRWQQGHMLLLRPGGALEQVALFCLPCTCPQSETHPVQGCPLLDVSCMPQWSHGQVHACLLPALWLCY